NVVNELLLLLGSRQLPVEEEIGDLEEVAFGGKLLDRVSPVEQYALIAIDIGDARATGSSGHKPGIVGEVAGLGVQLADVDDTRPDRPAQDRKLDRFSGCVVGQRHRSGDHIVPVHRSTSIALSAAGCRLRPEK